MRVILITDVDSVGRMGEIKEIKNGLARNYLIPQKMAIRASRGNIKIWEQKSNIIQKREEGLKAEAQGFASKLDGASVTIPVKVGEDNKLFGSVTSQNISDALKEIGLEVSRKNIELDSPIKEIGTHNISVRLYHEVAANITVEVQGHDADGNIVEVIAEPEPVVEVEAAEATEMETVVETEEESEEEMEETKEEE
jgi:large subunit ribosomal protein L9